MLRPALARLFSFVSVFLLAGCSANSPLATVPHAKGMSGSIHGGQQPISGATIQLYAVGNAGDGSASTPLLTSPVVTDSSGSFLITGLYTCPSASTLVYIVATGGSPSFGVTNSGIALMAALGPCSPSSPPSFIDINEITTVAAVYALAPFMSSFSAIGSGSGDAAALATAFTNAGYFADITAGSTPGPGVPAGYSVPVAQVDALSNLLSACINSAGGVSGDSSVCGMFYALTQPAGAPVSTNAIAALLNLANNPSLNTEALFDLIPPLSPFQPTQPIVPPDFSLRLLASSSFTVSPSAIAFAPTVVSFTQASQTVTVTNGTSAGVNIGSALITGINASDFAIVPGSDCPSTVPANSTCTFQLSFTPSATGARAAYFIVGNSSANPSIAVALSGAGVTPSAGPVTLSPSGLTFTQFGSPQTLTLTNQGVTPLSIRSIEVSGTFYSQTNNCGSMLPAASFCSVNVTAFGYSTDTPATLTVYDDAATGPQSASLGFSGLGFIDTPSSVDFGHWAIGATGSEALVIAGSGQSGTLNFSLTGANAADFSFAQNTSLLTSSCYYDYRAGSPCNLTLFYKPSVPGTSSAYFSIAGTTIAFPLAGTADPTGVDFDLFQTLVYDDMPASNVNPLSTFDLGVTPMGTPVSSSFWIRNTGTVAALSLNTPIISGPNAADFTVTTPSCASGCTPSITFTPSGTGTRTASLTYTEGSNTVTRILSLTGIGTALAPVLTAPTNLYFSDVPLGTISASQTITINAYQNHPIQASITSTYSGGPQPFVFIGPTSCASTPCTLNIAYAPTTSGDDGKNVYIIATDTVSLTTGNIQAYGQVSPLAYVSYSPTDLSFAAQALNSVSAPQTVTFTNSGTTVLALTFSVIPRGSSPTPDYTLVNHCPVSLAINASCTVDVRFAPVSIAGTLDTSLVINGANVTRYLALSGTSF